MADIITTGASQYAIGLIDTATILVNNVSPRNAEHVNGCASAAVQIQQVLGSGTTLKGSVADLATRLAVALNATGTLELTGFTGLVTNHGLIASSTTQMVVMNHTPIGVIQAFAGISTPPVNWLACDGANVSRFTYSKLFAITSTTYGVGDGLTTFTLPDLRGRTIVMVDGSANRITSASTNGVNADALGGAGGAETHIISTAEMPAHTHTLNTRDTSFSGTAGPPGEQTNTTNSTRTTNSTGGGGAHSNTQPWIALHYIIYAGA